MAPARRGACALWAVLLGVRGDVYMQNPRGSNNRLTEQSNNAQNQNRLFDSQNNAAGGYMVGDNCVPNCKDGNNQYAYTKEGSQKGVMYFYHGSELKIEWTTQHGCGYPGTNTQCQMVIQYMCNSDVQPDKSVPGLRDGRDADSSRRRTAGGNQENPQGANKADADAFERGRHEPFEDYDACRKRQRNKGLYTADQNLNNNIGATATRQNNNGNRRGLECPEERDYYPYWHPSGWRDAAIMTSKPEHCEFYRRESQNVREKGYCQLTLPPDTKELVQPEDQVPNNEKDCTGKGGTWQNKPPWDIDPPECIALPESRDNHHGNIANGQMASYTWKIPDTIPDGDFCVLRMRYNMTSGDFDKDPEAKDDAGFRRDIMLTRPWDPFFDLDSKYNQDGAPLKGDPKDDFVGLGWERSGPLQIQVNTAQFGRTFQDRSHMFKVSKRPDGMLPEVRIVNLNVRGRRGNIVQVYPAVEYDFVPDNVEVSMNDFVHFQWVGSDANPNGNAGNGKQGTDRSNLVQISGRSSNKPMPIEDHTLFFDARNTNPDSSDAHEGRARVEKFAFLDQQMYAAQAGTACPKNKQEIKDKNLNDNDDANCYQLNAAPAYFDGGLVEMRVSGTHHIASTRNNDYSNRSHKTSIKVLARAFRSWEIAALSLSSVALVAAGVMALSAAYAYLNPLSEAFSKRNRPLFLRLPCFYPCVRRKELERERYKQELKEAWSRAAESASKATKASKANSFEKLERENREEKVELVRSIKVSPAPKTRKVCGCCDRHVRMAVCCCFCPACRDDDGEADPATVIFVATQVIVTLFGYMNNRSGGFAFWFGIAKAGGYMLDFSLACILLPTMRTVQAYAMQVRALDDLFNDDPIHFHKVCFSFVALGTIIHVMGHVMHIRAITAAPKFQVATNDRERLSGAAIYELVFDYKNRFAVVTGVMILLLMAGMMLTASAKVRRHTFKFRACPGKGDVIAYSLLILAGIFLAPVLWPLALGRCCGWCCCTRRRSNPADGEQPKSKTVGGFVIFWAVHKLWAPVFALLLIHGPQCWIWFLFPLIMLLCDRLVSRERRSTQVVLRSAHLMKGNVLKLIFNVPPGFTYQAGHYIQLNCEQVNAEEWHPFTLTSAPEEDTLSVHIRCPDTQDWCSALRRALVEAPVAAISGGKEKGPGCRVTYVPQATQREALPDALRKTIEQVLFAVPQKVEVVALDSGVVTSTYNVTRARAPPPWLKKADTVAENEQEEKDGEATEKPAKKQAARTMSLDTFIRATAMPHDAIRMRIDGPHGAPSERVWKHRVVILVGAGIGVTPFASVIKSLNMRVVKGSEVGPVTKKKKGSASDSKTSQTSAPTMDKVRSDLAAAKLNWRACESVHFYWLCRSQEEFKWFSGLLLEAMEGPAKGRIRVNLYVTGTVEVGELKNLGSGIKTMAGRPDWPRIFPGIAEQHPGEDIGVFLCGPAAIRKGLVSSSNWAATQDKNGTSFNVYSENF